ncbi:MAG: DUF4105 domain-containing protein, partial [Thermoanaerobaculia bacterium]
MRRITAVALFVLLGLLIEATGGWGVLALAYSGPHNEVLRNSLSAAVALIAQAALIALGVRRWRWRVLSAYIVLFAVLLVWYFGIEPSNDREWQADVAVLPYATVEGDIVTVHDIRNFDYRSEADYTPAYYDKRFDVRELEGLDLVAV